MPPVQFILHTQELLCDDVADLLLPDQFVDLSKIRPADTVGLPRLQHDLLDGNVTVQAIVIVVGAALPDRLQKLEFLCTGTDAGFLIKFRTMAVRLSSPARAAPPEFSQVPAKDFWGALRVSKMLPLPS